MGDRALTDGRGNTNMRGKKRKQSGSCPTELELKLCELSEIEMYKDLSVGLLLLSGRSSGDSNTPLTKSTVLTQILVSESHSPLKGKKTSWESRQFQEWAGKLQDASK